MLLLTLQDMSETLLMKCGVFSGPKKVTAKPKMLNVIKSIYGWGNKVDKTGICIIIGFTFPLQHFERFYLTSFF